jgi:hypothetical protein
MITLRPPQPHRQHQFRLSFPPATIPLPPLTSAPAPQRFTVATLTSAILFAMKITALDLQDSKYQDNCPGCGKLFSEIWHFPARSRYGHGDLCCEREAFEGDYNTSASVSPRTSPALPRTAASCCTHRHHYPGGTRVRLRTRALARTRQISHHNRSNLNQQVDRGSIARSHERAKYRIRDPPRIQFARALRPGCGRLLLRGRRGTWRRRR